MNINRHNYEEFFLLYVDNELSAAERKAVEVFVQQNPDLQVELSSLLQTVVKADDIVLGKKEWLFMEEKATALQEELLLYADDELDTTRKRSVEALLNDDKAALAEWNILSQTKLQPDTAIIFTDKRSLYRTEGGRVIGIKWQRVAAAAILIGLALWAGMSIYKNNFKATGDGPIARENKMIPAKTQEIIAPNIPVTDQKKDDVTSQNSTTVAEQKKSDKQGNEKNANGVEKINNKNVPEQKENIAQDANKKPSNNLPKPYFENINSKQSNEMATTGVKPESSIIKGSGINDVAIKANPKEKIINPVIADPGKGITDPITTAVPVAYTGDENNNDRLLYMNEEKVKRTKLGGLLRQAKRVLERTANIKTGDGLKVAGFEIAIK